MDQVPEPISRFDSAALLSIFKVDGGENLLPFDEMEALLELGELEVPAGGQFISTAPVVTSESPGTTGYAHGQVLQSTSDGADNHDTRAAGWTSHPSSRPSSEGGCDSDDGSDLIDASEQIPQLVQPEQLLPRPQVVKHDHKMPQQQHTQLMETQPSSAFTTGDVSDDGGEGQWRKQPHRTRGAGDSSKATSSLGVRKRRQRNAEQMESNRVAQQKYRQRKRHEQSALQQAVDLLTAQVAALKAVEVRAGELEAHNTALRDTVCHQSASIASLQQQGTEAAAQLQSARVALLNSHAQVAAQGKLILDQQAKLRLQEQIIASLKDRLKERIDEAVQHVVPGTVCEKMVAAVKATLYGAKDVHGLQETLSQLPEHLVNEICKNIFHVCKESWSELRARCSQQAGGNSCMTGAA